MFNCESNKLKPFIYINSNYASNELLKIVRLSNVSYVLAFGAKETAF